MNGQCAALDCIGGTEGVPIAAGAAIELTWSGNVVDADFGSVPEACTPCAERHCKRAVRASTGNHTLSVAFEPSGGELTVQDFSFDFPTQLVTGAIEP